ncbi:polysaccharide deacetylase family protein [Bacillus sp. Marseille-P3661]|uniref:polysaccharide deacetylase family protein n=1 Tax=Bacillus sp. Marseille-P3661 TaxID=1936234 RepID=UPI00215568ED|nr:polysaccharide deacetylase family protein [Bacillus sp. Marseille-P3661]
MYDLKDNRWLTNVSQMKNNNDKVVLTFDDGPSRNLNTILDILLKEKVPAVFFWQSRLLYEKRPWKRVLAEGHRIGTHSINHKDLVRLSYSEQYRQIKSSKKSIEKITGETVSYFRPPFGRYNDATLDILERLQLTPIMWEISSYDWELKEQPYMIVNNVVENSRPGSIVLLHELEQTVVALPHIIKGIRAKGLDFCTF